MCGRIHASHLIFPVFTDLKFDWRIPTNSFTSMKVEYLFWTLCSICQVSGRVLQGRTN